MWVWISRSAEIATILGSIISGLSFAIQYRPSMDQGARRLAKTCSLLALVLVMSLLPIAAWQGRGVYPTAFVFTLCTAFWVNGKVVADDSACFSMAMFLIAAPIALVIDLEALIVVVYSTW